MSTLRIRLFGTFSVQRDDEDLASFDVAKVQELFCYLLLHPDHPCSRDSLTSLLWSDVPATQAKKYLRQTLWQLQTTVDSPATTSTSAPMRVIRVESDWIQLNRGANLWLDVAAFEAAFARVKGVLGHQLDPERARALRDAVDIYHGDLLEGWGQEWCLYERERLQNMYLSMLDKAMVYGEAHHDYEAALTYGAQVLRYDRAHERTHRRLMRLHYLAGDRTAALRQYERCVAALSEELDVRPARRTTALYEQIRSDRVEHVPDSSEQSNHVSAKAGLSLPEVLSRLKRLRGALGDFQRQVQRDIEFVEQSLRDG